MSDLKHINILIYQTLTWVCIELNITRTNARLLFFFFQIPFVSEVQKQKKWPRAYACMYMKSKTRFLKTDILPKRPFNFIWIFSFLRHYCFDELFEFLHKLVLLRPIATIRRHSLWNSVNLHYTPVKLGKHGFRAWQQGSLFDEFT